MKHLLKVISHPKIKKSKDALTTHKNKYTTSKRKNVYLCYKLGNYWCRFTVSQWADLLGIARSTLATRTKNKDNSIEQILGFKPIKRGKNAHK